MGLFVLVHSPLVGPSTWSPVADQLQHSGIHVLLPVLQDSPDPQLPFWKQHADSVARALLAVPNEDALTLVAHSGAGPLLPAIRRSIPHPVQSYIFVDAGIPLHNATRLDLMRMEDAEWANAFQKELEHGGRFPTWSTDDLREIIPDDLLRANIVSELRPRGLDFFTERIPVFDGWPDAPCVYIQFSDSYAWDAERARQAGWATYKVQAGHFHMLVEPKEVTQLIVDAVSNLL